MLDETNLVKEKKWFYKERAGVVIKNLQKKNINALYVPDRKEALNVIVNMIPEGAIVSRGDSVTLHEIGIIAELKKLNKNFVDPFERYGDGSLVADSERLNRMLREAFSADVFLSGINAVTLDGKLVNIDGSGNRIAPIIYGPKKVIAVAGINKIVQDVDAAIRRIHDIAAPLNAQRHYQIHQMQGFGTLPCVISGKCTSCNHDWKICNYVLIIEGTMSASKGRINVVLVGEELGL